MSADRASKPFLSHPERMAKVPCPANEGLEGKILGAVMRGCMNTIFNHLWLSKLRRVAPLGVAAVGLACLLSCKHRAGSTNEKNILDKQRAAGLI